MNDVQNRYPDVTTALTAFFRNTIRAIAATDSTNDILAMRDDFIEIERHLDAHGPGLYLFFTFTQLFLY